MLAVGYYVRCTVVRRDETSGKLVVRSNHGQYGLANPSRYGMPETDESIRVKVHGWTGEPNNDLMFFGQALPRKRDLRNGTGV